MRSIAAALLLCTFSIVPTPAQEAPLGIFRCHDPMMSPYGTLVLDGQGMYQMIGTSTPDWAANPDLPQNGAGSYSVDGTQLVPGDGPLKDVLAATGNFLGSGQEATIGFSDRRGTVLTCLSTVG